MFTRLTADMRGTILSKLRNSVNNPREPTRSDSAGCGCVGAHINISMVHSTGPAGRLQAARTCSGFQQRRTKTPAMVRCTDGRKLSVSERQQK